MQAKGPNASPDAVMLPTPGNRENRPPLAQMEILKGPDLPRTN